MKTSAVKWPGEGQARYAISVPPGPLGFQVRAAVQGVRQVLMANDRELEPGRLGLELVWQERSRDGSRFLVYREVAWGTKSHKEKEA